MDKIIIHGGKKLKGTVEISGSKNASLPILFATLLTDSKCSIQNVPLLKDIETAIELLKFFGKKVGFHDSKIIVSQNKKINIPVEAPYELIKKMRASFLVAGPLLARYGKVKVALPGGCAIGVRPVDIHLKGFSKLGAKIKLSEGYVYIYAKKLKPAIFTLPYPSVGATENLLLASVLTEGKTVLKNVAREPEIVDLANFLISLGAKIKGAGTKTIEIQGVSQLNGVKNYTVIPDRIEAGTFLIAGAITKGDIIVKNCIPEHLEILISKLKESGQRIIIKNNSIRIISEGRIKPVSIVTKPYPGFPTDLQAQWMAFMSQADGESTIKESVFENRFLHAAELQRLGAILKIKDDTVYVSGNSELSGAPVMVSDLRAGAALVLAGLAAKGITTVTHIYHLDRGYENLEKKLKKLGARIKRVEE
ncbi:MAG: UDP-N-acetylglucosamine 1-carboxyvinyltransferase [Endomicrobiia bacterium]